MASVVLLGRRIPGTVFRPTTARQAPNRRCHPGATSTWVDGLPAPCTFPEAEWLIRENREDEERCSLMLANLGIRRGMTICDLGCGNGFHSIPMAKLTGDQGMVLGVDIQPEMLTKLRTRCEQQGVDNVIPILGSLHNPRLPPNSVDLNPAGGCVSRVLSSGTDAGGNASRLEARWANRAGRISGRGSERADQAVAQNEQEGKFSRSGKRTTSNLPANLTSCPGST